VIEQDATLGVFCRRWGVPLIDGGTVRLPQIIGLGRALDLILTGRPVGAEEALAMGLANRVVPTGTARVAAEALAHELAALPQSTMRSDRASVLASQEVGVSDALEFEFRVGLASLQSGGAADVERFVSGAGRGGAPA